MDTGHFRFVKFTCQWGSACKCLFLCWASTDITLKSAFCLSGDFLLQSHVTLQRDIGNRIKKRNLSWSLATLAVDMLARQTANKGFEAAGFYFRYITLDIIFLFEVVLKSFQENLPQIVKPHKENVWHLHLKIIWANEITMDKLEATVCVSRIYIFLNKRTSSRPTSPAPRSFCSYRKP